MTPTEIVCIIMVIVLCILFSYLLSKAKNDSYSEGHFMGYREGYHKGYVEGQNSVEIPVQPEIVATELVYSTKDDDDIYGPDTSDWSPLIPQATRQKLIEGITAFNRSSDQKRTTKKF